MTPSLKGRHALVCGASRGIGRAAAVALARRGAQVTALARSADALRELVGELREAGGADPRGLPADLDDHAGLQSAIRELLAEAGDVHIVINNASGPPSGRLLDATPDQFAASLHRHLGASHLLVQACLPGMQRARFGRIVQVLSFSVYEPLENLGVSNLTRAAVASWAKTLARELPPGITINNVLPGFTDTERMTSLFAAASERTGTSADEIRAAWLADVPEGRMARPEETAAAIAFLASEEAAYIRGVSLAVDGGRLHSI